jgi:fatty acid desaturase
MLDVRHEDLPAEVHSIPNGINAAIVVGQWAGFVGLVALVATVSGWWLLLLGPAFAVWMVGVYSAVHEAEHGVLFGRPIFNTIGGVLLSALVPAPYHLLRQSHTGHHQRNRSDDEAFDLWFPGESPIWKWVQWIGILTGGFYVFVALSNVVVLFLPFVMKRQFFRFDRPSGAFMDSLNPRYRLVMALEGAGVILLHVGVVLSIGVPIWKYLVLYACFGATWSALQYVFHYATERHVTRGARNLWLFPAIDALWLHHNLHLTHHEHPTVSWIHLPKLRRGGPIGWLPWHYLKMWRGPRAATDSVANRFAGKVVR